MFKLWNSCKIQPYIMLTTLYYSAPLCTVKQSYKKYSYFPLFTQILFCWIWTFWTTCKMVLIYSIPPNIFDKTCFWKYVCVLGMPDTPFSPPLMYSTPVCPITLLPLYIGEHRQIYLFFVFLCHRWRKNIFLTWDLWAWILCFLPPYIRSRKKPDFW